MSEQKSGGMYQKTLYTCYLGIITQAIVVNFAPMLFLKFHYDYGISLGKIAYIPILFFFMQILVDVFCAHFVDRIGYRKCVVTSEILVVLGLVSMAVLSSVLSDPFTGILISVMIYACGSGLLEVLVSPIVEACPFDNKESVMSLLHSFYCWGSVGVIVLSTLYFRVFGIAHWRILACIWALIPLFNAYNFLTCPIRHLTEEGKGMRVGEMLRVPMFWIAIVLMICAGASEIAMSQWASAYAEAALGLAKSICDIAGPCLFAAAMGVARTFYGKYGEKIDLRKFMIFSGILCFMCYMTAALSTAAPVGLLGCIICGFSVGIMWPGTISIFAEKLPAAGTVMFALLAMSGDLGGSMGPGIVGMVTEHFHDNLQIGMLFGAVFPAVLTVSSYFLGRMSQYKE